MNVIDLAAQPIFILSLGLCAAVATAGITTFLKTLFQRTSNALAFWGLSHDEVVSLEAASRFNTILAKLVKLVLRIEEHSAELPGVFHDHSWARLLKMCDDLEAARSELHELLGARKFTEAAQLGRFLCGIDPSLPLYNRDEKVLDLRQITFWRRDGVELLHRMVSKIEEAGRTHDEDLNPRSTLSPELQEVIEDAKDYIEKAEILE